MSRTILVTVVSSGCCRDTAETLAKAAYRVERDVIEIASGEP